MRKVRGAQKKLLVFCPVNPLRSYSGVKYLCDALAQRGVDLELWAYIPKNMLHETSGWRFTVRSFLNKWYWPIPRIRFGVSKLHVLFLGLTTDAAILFIDLTFVKQIALIKKLRPKKVLIHYCTEFFTAGEVPQIEGALQFYQQFANIPDLVIEVETNRAKLRKEWYSMSKTPLVIPNTIPKSEIPPQSHVGRLAKLAGIQFPAGVPVLLYSGAVFLHRELDLLVDALAGMRRRPFFLAFCYGDVAAIADLRQKCVERLEQNQVKICDAVPRTELLACIHEADAGYVYYRPSLTIGNLYAAPTKLFEYIAVGLPVIASNNPEIVKLIDEGGLGLCVKDESVLGLRDAIESLLFDSERLACIRERQREKFESELCYEVAARSGIQAIMDLLNSKTPDTYDQNDAR